MTVLRGWRLPEQHLALDAIVAFVDGELSPNAHDRAAAHLARCPACAADAAAQRQTRAAVRAAETPSISPRLLQALQAIPTTAELPGQPDGLAFTEDGQLVTINRTDRPVFGSGPTLGSSTPLGGGQQPLGSSAPFSGSPRRTQRGSRHFTRRTRQGAGVVFSGLVLGALAFINLPAGDKDDAPVAPRPAGPPNNTVLPASTGTSAPPEATLSTEAPVTASSSLPAPGAPVPTTP